MPLGLGGSRGHRVFAPPPDYLDEANLFLEWTPPTIERPYGDVYATLGLYGLARKQLPGRPPNRWLRECEDTKKLRRKRK